MVRVLTKDCAARRKDLVSPKEVVADFVRTDVVETIPFMVVVLVEYGKSINRVPLMTNTVKVSLPSELMAGEWIYVVKVSPLVNFVPAVEETGLWILELLPSTPQVLKPILGC